MSSSWWFGFGGRDSERSYRLHNSREQSLTSYKSMTLNTILYQCTVVDHLHKSRGEGVVDEWLIV